MSKPRFCPFCGHLILKVPPLRRVCRLCQKPMTVHDKFRRVGRRQHEHLFCEMPTKPRYKLKAEGLL